MEFSVVSSNLSSTLNGKFDGQCNEQDGKASAEYNVGQVLCRETTEISSDCEADRDPQPELQIDVPGLVVGPEREDPDGQQQGRDGCTLRGLLGHAVEEDQGGNQKCPASDPDHAGDDADDYA